MVLDMSNITYATFDPRELHEPMYALVIDVNKIPDSIFDEVFALTTATPFRSFNGTPDVMIFKTHDPRGVEDILGLLLDSGMVYFEDYCLYYGPIPLPISEPLQKLRSPIPTLDS